MTRLARLDHVGDAPMDRHTRICEALGVTFENHPEVTPDDHLIVLAGNEHKGGAMVVGYEDEAAVLADLLCQVQVIAQALGKRCDIAFLDDEGVARFDGSDDGGGL